MPAKQSFKKLYIFSADTPEAKKTEKKILDQHDICDLKEADIVISLGGDGTLLETLHFLNEKNIDLPVYGINCGSVGFLLNPQSDSDLLEKINSANNIDIFPLRLESENQNGDKSEAIAYNEVSLLRETRQTAKLKISVDQVERINELICDGILLSTPAGSTAYNLSANGPILPISANLLALTPISAFRPRRWRGALLPDDSTIEIDVHNPKKRPVSVTADSKEFRDITKVRICQSQSNKKTLLFDPDHNLGERILKEQFVS